MDFDAIPPSSPPPHASTSHTDSSPFFEPRARKYPLKSSSPPPLFSSDDSRESVDVTNYQSPRIFKNKRKGAWWDNSESAQNTPEPKKSKMTRNFDSGVYMMSDATDASEDPLPIHKSPFPFGLDDTCDERDDPPPPELNPRVVALNDMILSSVEKNHPIYHFPRLGLEDEDIKGVGVIASVIKNVPDPGDELPAEGQFRSMEPEIYINFTDNKLCRLTPTLFDIQYLTTLVLRNNDIEELPQELCRLENLKILDVSLNSLKSLPFEILRLLQPYGNLERVNTIGNPLLEPMTSARFHQDAYVGPPRSSMWNTDALPLDRERDEASLQLPVLYKGLTTSSDRQKDVWRIRYFESWANSFSGGDNTHEDTEEDDIGFLEHHPSLPLDCVSPKAPRYMARTPVSYFDRIGSLIGNSPAPPSASQSYPVIVETNAGAYDVPSSWFEPASRPTVPSLSTMSFQSALKARHFDDQTIEDVRDMLVDPSEALPPTIEAMFTRATENNAGGWGEFRKCHVCKKDYVVSRAEWVEFWSAGAGVFYPLKVKVCSWGCVPARVVNRPKKELTW
ncbi:hypothetical protein T440DRAFT_464649 [Plenodomus tracheiphilus IPT5]|uniref:Leucine rich repeat domain-containing protein n=1 Tax=Plenodomus tracheiphilus IPT5 TaxID=1408161 RepID=A0A6A7BGF9_9PLEO|nr:hypothetical protein T440DRAFT_464649 [Plenodomus tracheiphilus IPT5]